MEYNKILTNERVISFLKYIAPDNKEKGYNKLFKKLGAGKSLEEIFKKDKTGYGYILTVEKKSETNFEIELGIGWESSNMSYTWEITFSRDGVIKSVDIMMLTHNCD